jgi:hypothetical protein
MYSSSIARRRVSSQHEYWQYTRTSNRLIGAGVIARLRGVTVDAIQRELQEPGIVPDPLESTDDPLPIVDLNDDELDELLENGPQPAS